MEEKLIFSTLVIHISINVSYIKTTRDFLVIIFTLISMDVSAQLIGEFVPVFQDSDTHQGKMGVLIAETYTGDKAIVIHNYVFEEVTTLALQNEEIQLNVYPNPVSDVLNIISEETITSLMISDLTGRKLISKTALSTKQMDINLKELSVSVVLLTLTFNNEKVKKIKISKVR